MNLDYPITRPFPNGWRWFTPLSFVGAFICLIFLCAINVALTGYETVTVFESNFNATQSHWYDKFMPYRVPTPGTLCGPHVFNVGDPFTTNYTFFEWTIESITKANAGKSGFSYQGATLIDCDVSSIYVDGDLRSWSVALTVVVQCQHASAKTSVTFSFLPGRASPLLGVVTLNKGGDMRPAVFDTLLGEATQDLGASATNTLLSSNYTSPVAVSLQADFSFCPMSLGPSAPCGFASPNFTIASAAIGMSNLSVTEAESAPDAITLLDDSIKLPISNLLQTVYAIIRVELGNPSPNNFVLYPNVTGSVIVPRFPASLLNPGGDMFNSTLYKGWMNPDPETKKYLPVTVAGPASIQVVYACRFQQRKLPAQLFISVLVATLSMFSTGWGLYMVMAIYFAKRISPLANHCEGHGDIQFQQLSRSNDSHPLQPVDTYQYKDYQPVEE